MKRFVGIVAGLTFGVAFVSAPLAAEKVKIGFITQFPGEPYSTVEKSAMDQAKRDGNIDLILGEGTSVTDVKGQVALVDSMIAQGVGAIAITPVDPTVATALDKAVANGIKVVLIGDEIPGWGGLTAYVGTNNIKAGIHAGQWLHDHTRDGDKFGMLGSASGARALDDRATGLLQGLGDRRLNIVANTLTKCDQEDGATAAAEMLAAHTDLAGIFSVCGPLAIRAIQALKLANVDFTKFTLVGFDICCGEREALLAGEEDATIAPVAERMGQLGLVTAAKAARGENVDANVNSGNILVTGENADEVK